MKINVDFGRHEESRQLVQLRLPKSLVSAARRSAEERGLSLNEFAAQALENAVLGPIYSAWLVSDRTKSNLDQEANMFEGHSASPLMLRQVGPSFFGFFEVEVLGKIQGERMSYRGPLTPAELRSYDGFAQMPSKNFLMYLKASGWWRPIRIGAVQPGGHARVVLQKLEDPKND